MHISTYRSISVHCLFILCALISSFGTACNDDATSPDVSTSNACGEGSAVEDGDETYCVYEEGLIIEGFRCVAPFSFRHDFRAFAVCSSSAQLPNSFLDQLRQEGYNPEPLPPGLPGDGCTRDGAVTIAEDGCNTCTCEDGGWSCTEIACSEVFAVDAGDACDEEGASAPAGDGCNSCTCTEGTWGCTEIACQSSCNEVITEGFCNSTSGCRWGECNGLGPCIDYGGACIDEEPRPHQCSDFDDDPTSCEAGGCMWVACAEGETCDDLAPFCSPPVVCGQTCDLEGFQAGDRCGPVCDGDTWSCTEEFCPSEENCSAIDNRTSCVEQTCSWVECTDDGPDCMGEFAHCTAPVEPGDPCSAAGSPTTNAADGCNTCFCDGEAWSCTEIACE